MQTCYVGDTASTEHERESDGLGGNRGGIWEKGGRGRGEKHHLTLISGLHQEDIMIHRLAQGNSR